ncbi:MAG: ABC transporter ATP-binding protein [Verrucomicrobiota bacterium]|nr:ABC transporter ATP-binding protein [Verrucomicrobiota bacterium]
MALQKQEFWAVQDVSFKLHRGESMGIIGPNGSGKSTTLKIILGLISPTTGRVEIFGRDHNQRAARNEIGFLPENAYFHKFLTAEETLKFHAKLTGLSREQTKTRVDEILATVGLASARHARLHTFSKGMLQRIGLAQALIHDPKILVLDEPTSGVDPAGTRDIQTLIRALQARGVTVLLSSHFLTQVEEVCDPVGILHRGELKREGRLDDLLALRNQTQLTIENASPALLEKLETQIVSSDAKLIARGNAHTSLEQYFLDVIA